ncbi:hypothetical protein Zmor_008640 [Zophobas morio]|uniref:Uncharacterized protein n=1 Tax=Zophobas morio TaxID=2755281 RepID=A0AA38LZD0_9CUCU|nr:hypothetical protein Zmor_008640 [Zophobas morio]
MPPSSGGLKLKKNTDSRSAYKGGPSHVESTPKENDHNSTHRTTKEEPAPLRTGNGLLESKTADEQLAMDALLQLGKDYVLLDTSHDLKVIKVKESHSKTRKKVCNTKITDINTSPKEVGSKLSAVAKENYGKLIDVTDGKDNCIDGSMNTEGETSLKGLYEININSNSGDSNVNSNNESNDLVEEDIVNNDQ